MTKTGTFLVTHTLRPAGVELLTGHVDIVYALSPDQRQHLHEPDPDGSRQRAIDAALEHYLPTAVALHSFGKVTRPMLDRAPQLRVIVVSGSGYDNVDIDAATDLGIAVVNAAGASYEPVAEHVIGLMLSLAKWIAASDRQAHQDRRSASNRAMLLSGAPAPSTLWGKTIGIVGFGFIGRCLAQKCRDAFGMTVLAHDPYFDANEAERLGVRLTHLEQVLAESDYVSLNAPLTAETEHLMDSSRLALMKPTAILINTARGGLVDLDALVDSLRAASIAGAGLDVTEPEPLPDGHPLFDFENVVLTPHIAGISTEYLARNSASTARDALRVLAGERPQQLVNPSVWPRYLERFGASPPA